MNGLSRAVARFVVASAVFLVLACLPVVPVLQAPVVPDPIYRSSLVSLLQLVGGSFLVGVRLQATWLTLPVLIGLVAATVLVVRAIDRRLFGRKPTSPRP